MVYKPRNKELKEELKLLNSSLSEVENPLNDEIPIGYFDSLYDKINPKTKKSVYHLSLKWVLSTAAGLILIVAFIRSSNSNPAAPQNLNEEIISYLNEDNQLYHDIIGDSDVNIEDLNLQYIVDEDIEAYLMDHVDDLDLENINN